MFASRYFATRYYPTSYFAKVGAAIAPVLLQLLWYRRRLWQDEWSLTGADPWVPARLHRVFWQYFINADLDGGGETRVELVKQWRWYRRVGG